MLNEGHKDNNLKKSWDFSKLYIAENVILTEHNDYNLLRKINNLRLVI